MKKYRILPLIAITTLTGVTFPLVSCNKNKEEPLGPLCFTNVADNNENSVISYEAHGLTVGVDKDIDIEYTYTPDVDNSWQKWELKENSSTQGKDLTLENGQSIYVRNTKSTLSQSYEKYFHFIMSGKIAASGNTDSLINYSQLSNCCFLYLFGECTSLIQAPELPAKKIAESCYAWMFNGCDSLVIAPKILPATTLACDCYNSMFNQCYSLLETPKLPATILAESCYNQMFRYCYSLTQVPNRLPAMSLANDCYKSMFSGCQSITKAPELPATVLAKNCYFSMFDNCKSLSHGPSLPKATLVDGCYYTMFWGCSSLNVTQDSGAHLICDFRNVTFLESDVGGMFLETGGQFQGTPTANHTYYWN